MRPVRSLLDLAQREFVDFRLQKVDQIVKRSTEKSLGAGHRQGCLKLCFWQYHLFQIGALEGIVQASPFIISNILEALIALLLHIHKFLEIKSGRLSSVLHRADLRQALLDCFVYEVLSFVVGSQGSPSFPSILLSRTVANVVVGLTS